MPAVLNSYVAKVDSRKRITLRNAGYDCYSVQELEDGRIILKPRVLTEPYGVSADALSVMDSSIRIELQEPGLMRVPAVDTEEQIRTMIRR